MKTKYFIMVIFLLVPWAVLAQNLVIGSKSFTESQILARMAYSVLKANDYEVSEAIGIPTERIRPALIDGRVSLYWEYTGTVYRRLWQGQDFELMRDSKKLFEHVKRRDYEENKLLWLPYARFSNSWALAVRGEMARLKGLTQISDIAKISGYKIGTTPRFTHAKDGLLALFRFYGLDFPESGRVVNRGISASVGYLERKLVDVTILFTTDAVQKEKDFVLLEDDKRFFPQYNPSIVISEETATLFPGIVKILSRIAPTLSQSEMIDLNHQVDFAKKSIDEVVQNFLVKKGLL